MKLSRTACYAIRAITYIAREGEESPIVGHEAAKDLQLSGSFLLRILVAMSRAGLLRSIKGPNGGYRLARPVEKISLLDVVEAVEGPVRGASDPVSSRDGGKLDRKLAEICDNAAEGFRSELAGVKLAYLADGNGNGKRRGKARKS
jgi:Rrf2 family protein